MSNQIQYHIDGVHAETLPSGRTYYTPDGAYPSITTLLGKTSPNQIWLAKWRERVGDEEADRISREATERGELVHQYVEHYWNGVDIKERLETEPYRVKQPTEAIIEATLKGVEEVYAQEIPLWSPSLQYAGRVDMVAVWKGQLSIIDFKTSKKEKKAKDIKDYFIQTCGYAYAHNELYKTRINSVVIIIGVDNVKKAQVFEHRASPHFPDLKLRTKQFHETYKKDI